MNHNTSSIHEIYDHAEKMLENGKDKDAILEYLVSNDIYHTIAEEIYDEILLTKLGIKHSKSNAFFAWALMVVSLFIALSSLLFVSVIFFYSSTKSSLAFDEQKILIEFIMSFIVSVVFLLFVNRIYNGKMSKYWSLLLLVPFLFFSIMLLL